MKRAYKQVLVLCVTILFGMISLSLFNNKELFNLSLSIGMMVIFLFEKKILLKEITPYIIPLVLIVFNLYEIYTTPVPKITILVENSLLDIPKERVNIVSAYQMRNVTYLQVVPKGYEGQVQFYQEDESEFHNSYFISLNNSGKVDLFDVIIYFRTPFILKEEDIIYQDIDMSNNYDKGSLQYGEFSVIIPYLESGATKKIIYKNQKIGYIIVNRCVSSYKEISSDSSETTNFIFKVPENRTVYSSSGLYPIPDFAEEGFYDFTEGKWVHRVPIEFYESSIPVIFK